MTGSGLAAVLALTPATEALADVPNQPATAVVPVADQAAGPPAPMAPQLVLVQAGQTGQPSGEPWGGRVSIPLGALGVGVLGFSRDDQNTAFTIGAGPGQGGRFSTGDISPPANPSGPGMLPVGSAGLSAGVMVRGSYNLPGAIPLPGGYSIYPLEGSSASVALDIDTTGQVQARLGYSAPFGPGSPFSLQGGAGQATYNLRTGEWETSAPLFFGRYTFGQSERFVAGTLTLTVPNEVIDRLVNMLPEPVQDLIFGPAVREELVPDAPAVEEQPSAPEEQPSFPEEQPVSGEATDVPIAEQTAIEDPTFDPSATETGLDFDPTAIEVPAFEPPAIETPTYEPDLGPGAVVPMDYDGSSLDTSAPESVTYEPTVTEPMTPVAEVEPLDTAPLGAPESFDPFDDGGYDSGLDTGYDMGGSDTPIFDSMDTSFMDSGSDFGGDFGGGFDGGFSGGDF